MLRYSNGKDLIVLSILPEAGPGATVEVRDGRIRTAPPAVGIAAAYLIVGSPVDDWSGKDPHSERKPWDGQSRHRVASDQVLSLSGGIIGDG